MHALNKICSCKIDEPIEIKNKSLNKNKFSIFLNTLK